MEAVLESFVTGLPVLLLHYLVTLTMLAIGVTIYILSSFWIKSHPLNDPAKTATETSAESS